MKAVAAAVIVLLGFTSPGRSFEALCESEVACWAVTPFENQLATCGSVLTIDKVRKHAPRDLKRAAKLTKRGELLCASILTHYVDQLFASIPKAPPPAPAGVSRSRAP